MPVCRKNETMWNGILHGFNQFAGPIIRAVLRPPEAHHQRSSRKIVAVRGIVHRGRRGHFTFADLRGGSGSPPRAQTAWSLNEFRVIFIGIGLQPIGKNRLHSVDSSTSMSSRISNESSAVRWPNGLRFIVSKPEVEMKHSTNRFRRPDIFTRSPNSNPAQLN